jgi:signal transduction histidine kinase
MSDQKRLCRASEYGRAGGLPADELMAVLSHELRSPIGCILVALDSIHPGRSDEGAVERARDRAERQALKMARIIDDTLDLARGARGKLVLRPARVDLAAVIAGAVETAEPALAAGDHRLTVSLPPEPVFLVADGPRLEQVLVNLLTNAARYTHTGGDIRLAAAAAAGLVFLRVKDDGIGIAPDLLPHVFDLFRQGPGCDRRVPGGLGIGLAVVKSVVESHGGTVTAYSGGPGTGSEFVVRLPADGPGRAAHTELR